MTASDRKTATWEWVLAVVLSAAAVGMGALLAIVFIHKLWHG
jgi:hypothetical protein